MIRHLVGLTALALCACAPNDRTQAGELTVEWLGADTGGLSAKPVAQWCAGDTALKITATKGEAGVGLLILPAAEPEIGEYTVFDPLVDSTRVRPGMIVGSRWVDDKTVVAYQSDSGLLTLNREPTGLSGRFTVRMHDLNRADTVRMTGHFGGITPGACPGAPAAPNAPPQ